VSGLNAWLDSAQTSLTLDASRVREVLSGGNASQALAGVLVALRNPADNPATVLLALGVLAVVVLIAMLILWYVMMGGPGPREAQAAGEPIPKEAAPRSRRRALTLALVALVAALAVAGSIYATSDAACARCHVNASAVASHAKSSHSNASCRSCHVGPGVRNAFIANVTGVRNIVHGLRRSTTSTPSVIIGNEACLACHAKVANSVVVARGVRMRHQDVLEVGYVCIDCHNTAGHGEAVKRVQSPKMSQCIACHDGRKVANACTLCHSDDVGVAGRTPGQGFLKVHIEFDSCRGCHSMKTCIDCHGLELPHSKEFIAGAHARKGHLEPKTCLKCHTVQGFCNNCHLFNSDPSTGLPVGPHEHEGDFVKWHTRISAQTTLSCPCHVADRGLPNRQQFCDFCHGPQPPN
jgi:hypothetical protein